MSRTFDLYDAMNEFRRAQIANRETYMQKKKRLEAYKGSAGYAEDMKKIREERDKANAAARAACRAKIDPLFKSMHEANAKRKIEAPSEEHIRILTVASMLVKPSKSLMGCIANSLDGNSLSLAALDSICGKAWDLPATGAPIYSTGRAAKELNPQAAADAINSLQRTCNEILEGSGANRIREMSADRNMRVHGGQFDPDDLPQEPEYVSERDFYQREGCADYALFAASVNA